MGEQPGEQDLPEGRDADSVTAETRAEEEARPASSRFMAGKVVNAPTVPNNGGYENRVSLSKPVVARTAGFNSVVSGAQAFEQRVQQELGTH